MGKEISNGWSDIISNGSENSESDQSTTEVKNEVQFSQCVVEVKEEPKKVETRKRITPKINRKDSIVKRLLFGGPSTGKTRAALAYFYYEVLSKNKDAVCWYVDTERGLKETLKEFPDDIDKSLEVFECNNFGDAVRALKVILENVQPKDVIIIDMLTVMWSWAQETYTLQVFHEDITEFYISRRRELIANKSGKGAFDGWKDWVGIKMLHNKDFIDELVRQTGAELIGICSAKEVEMNDLEKKKMVTKPTIFTPVGFAPEGEKHNDHRFDRIIYFWRGIEHWYTKAPKYRGNVDMMLKRVTIPKGEFPKI